MGTYTNTHLGPALLTGNGGWTAMATLPVLPSGGTHNLFGIATTPSAGFSDSLMGPTISAVTGNYPTPGTGGSTQNVNATMTNAAIQSAINAAGVNGVVIYAAGTYNNFSVTPLTNQVHMAAHGATVTLRGSYSLTSTPVNNPITGSAWIHDVSGLWTHPNFPVLNWNPPADLGSNDPSRALDLVTNPNDLYFNGVPLTRVEHKTDLVSGTFWVDAVPPAGGYANVWCFDDPTGKITAASNQACAFAGGGFPNPLQYVLDPPVYAGQPTVNGVTLQNLNISQYACVENNGAISFIGSSSLKLINVNCQFNHSCGATTGAVNVYGGIFSHNGQLGIMCAGQDGLTGPLGTGGVYPQWKDLPPITNVFATGVTANANNWARYNAGYGAGGFKCLWATGINVKYSELINNLGDGFWADTECGGSLYYNTSQSNYTFGTHIEFCPPGFDIQYNVLSENMTDGHTGDIQGCNFYVVSSHYVTFKNNVVIVAAGQGGMGLDEDTRGYSMSANYSNNIIINVGPALQGVSSNGEVPPQSEQILTWGNNTYYLPTAGSMEYAWLDRTTGAWAPFYDNTFSKPSLGGGEYMESGSTYNYSANPVSSYRLSLPSTATCTFVEQFLPDSGSTTASDSGQVFANGTFTGPFGTTVDLWVQTYTP